MEKSTFTPLYEHFRRRLVAMREKAGLSQRNLAERLGREHSFVSRIELAERRLDVVEFYWVAQACGVNPAKVTADLMGEFAQMEGDEPAKATRRRKSSRNRDQSPRPRRGE